MNDADKMREKFEACVSKLKYLPPVLTLDEDGDYDTHHTSQLYSVWKEATKQQDDEIEILTQQIILRDGILLDNMTLVGDVERQNKRIKDLEAQIEHQRAMLGEYTK